MQKYSVRFFFFTILINYCELGKAVVYNNNYNVEEKYKPEFQSNYKQRFNNLSPINHRPYLETLSTYLPTIVDYDDVLHNRQLQSQHLEDTKLEASSPHLAQFHTPQQLFKTNPNTNIANQVAIKSKETAISSGDHSKTHSVIPSPSNLEMHPNLHDHMPLIIYKHPTIVSHATGNEPSPTASHKSIKSLTSTTTMQPAPTIAHNQKLTVNNLLNNYDHAARKVSNVNVQVSKDNSKQYLYAPLRTSVESQLPYSSDTLPYPPSFIYITTTDKPLFSEMSVSNEIPDFFTHRQYKSLWDSYIPSWHVMKMLQHLKDKSAANNKNNLHTLALLKQSKGIIENENYNK